MSPKTSSAQLVAMRVARKSAAVLNRLLRRASHSLQRVEDRTTARILSQGAASTSISAHLASTYPRLRPITAVSPLSGQRPSVTVFAFLDQGGFFGGIATLLNASAMLAKALDYDLRVVQTISFTPDADVLGFLRSQGIEFSAGRYSTVDLSKRRSGDDRLPLHEDDVIMVSAWWDAYVAERLGRAMPFVYLVQDYEPIFYDNGDSQVLAESTYRSGRFIPLVNTSVLAEFFTSESYAFADDAVVFEPAVSTNAVRAVACPTPRRTLFLYGRPEVHRNLFHCGLAAVDGAFRSGAFDASSWRVCVAGSDAVPALSLPDGTVIERLGKMPLDEYRAFIDTVDVAVSPMLAPHPNYPTLEFASVGIPVITTAWRSKTDLSRYGGDIRVVAADADELATAIATACANAEAKTRRAEHPFRLSRSWLDALGPAARTIADRIQESIRAQSGEAV